jgi:hypothetical protein
VTSSGPSPVRGFIAAIRHLFLFQSESGVQPPYIVRSHYPLSVT